MPYRQATLHEDQTFQVLRSIERNPESSQRELAKAAKLSLGGFNYCLKALIEKGFVKMERFSRSENKWSYVYLLTPHGVAARAQLTEAFLKRKLAEYEAIKAEIKSLKDELKDEG